MSSYFLKKTILYYELIFGQQQNTPVVLEYVLYSKLEDIIVIKLDKTFKDILP